MIAGFLPEPPRWHRLLRLVAIPASLLLHGAFSWVFLSGEIRSGKKSQWIEMAVVEPKAPEPIKEPPRPEPRKEPPRPKPAPTEPVDFKETVPEPPRKAAPAEQPRTVRRIQGLSSSSFAPGAGTGFGVRYGNTTRVAAGPEALDLDAKLPDAVPVAQVTTQPRACTKPPVQVPKEAIDNNVEGTIHMTLDLDASGRVVGVHFKNMLGHGVEEACREAALQVRCKPGMQDGNPVPIRGMPHRCTIKAID
jgi:outer membrane biosynthesis protein TonB